MLILFGGAGFIGRHICEYAHSNAIETTVVSTKPASAFMKEQAPSISTITSSGKLHDSTIKSAKTIVYLANSSKPATNRNDLSNEVSGNTLTAVEFIEHVLSVNPNCRIIYLSSGGQIYGDGHMSPISETDPTKPMTLYGFGKTMTETALNYMRDVQNHNITILRLSNPVGHWQIGSSHGLVSIAVNCAVTKTPLTIFGKGNNQRDYFDVDEFAEFVCKMHQDESAVNGIFNIGSGIGLGELDIVKLIEKTLNCNLDVEFKNARPFDFPYAVLNISKASNLLNWKPIVPLSSTIRKIAQTVGKTFET